MLNKIDATTIWGTTVLFLCVFLGALLAPFPYFEYYVKLILPTLYVGVVYVIITINIHKYKTIEVLVGFWYTVGTMLLLLVLVASVLATLLSCTVPNKVIDDYKENQCYNEELHRILYRVNETSVRYAAHFQVKRLCSNPLYQ